MVDHAYVTCVPSLLAMAYVTAMFLLLPLLLPTHSVRMWLRSAARQQLILDGGGDALVPSFADVVTMTVLIAFALCARLPLTVCSNLSSEVQYKLTVNFWRLCC